jgi:hypothetical protein
VTKDVDHRSKISPVVEEAMRCIMANCQAEMAKDVINISISDPDCCDLTIIDLPGIVRSVGDSENVAIIDDVQDIIHDYLVNER